MSLYEETLSQKSQPSYTSCKAAIDSNRALREQMARETEAYLRSGGIIKRCTPAGNIIVEPIITPRPEDASKRVNARNVKVSQAGKHLNIVELKTKIFGSTRYKVVIARNSYGVYDYLKSAIERRDSVRARLKLKPAEF